MVVENNGPTLAERRAERIAQLVCGEGGPPVNGDEVYPTCTRISGHQPPHRQIRAQDFGVVAEWEGDSYTQRPPRKK